MSHSEHEERDNHSVFHTIAHKSHSGVQFIALYELVTKVHELAPDWIEMLKTFLEGLRHAHI